MPAPQLFCPVPQSQDFLETAMAHVATLPWLKDGHGLLVQFEYDAPQWFAIIHRTPDSRKPSEANCSG
ncbi:unnamed protein product [Gemmata massiliana]|uniref:Uncharacterized protein n=1 Tax=Gemmata massiliana TaxID=1210884 RepID=A0A6P2DAK2_9BACT|nr:unnamed protein product [Gemmata massiliana]